MRKMMSDKLLSDFAVLKSLQGKRVIVTVPDDPMRYAEFTIEVVKVAAIATTICENVRIYHKYGFFTINVENTYLTKTGKGIRAYDMRTKTELYRFYE